MKKVQEQQQHICKYNMNRFYNAIEQLELAQDKLIEEKNQLAARVAQLEAAAHPTKHWYSFGRK